MSERVERIAEALRSFVSSGAEMQESLDQVPLGRRAVLGLGRAGFGTTQQTSEATQQIAASAQELATTAEHLQRLVSQFTL